MLPANPSGEYKMSRYRDISVAEMNPAQKRVHDQIIAGKRGRFGGPFQLLIRAPEICEYASKLGEHLRWGTSLPDRLSELAIITTARFWRAQYEWYAHAPLAEKAGVPAAAIEAIRTGGTPVFTAADETLIYRTCSEIFRTQRLSEASFGEAVKAFGENGLVEVIAIIGYYTLIGNTLNVFQVGLPEGEKPPFPE
jgi:4-carboxymuconolactone decarboxylase